MAATFEKYRPPGEGSAPAELDLLEWLSLQFMVPVWTD